MDYMMAAKPVIHAVRAWNDPVAESACGVSIPPGQPQAIADAIRRLLELSAAQRADLGRKGRAFASSRYDYRVLAQQYLAEFRPPDIGPDFMSGLPGQALEFETAKRTLSRVPGKTAEALSSSAHRAARTLVRWGELSGATFTWSSSGVTSRSAAPARMV